MRKPVFGVSDQVRHNQSVDLQKIARGLKFRIKEVEGLYYPYSENKGADQLRDYRKPDLQLYFRRCKKPVFSQRGSYDDFCENKGADQLHGNCQLICAFVFAYAKRRFSYNGFHIERQQGSIQFLLVVLCINSIGVKQV